MWKENKKRSKEAPQKNSWTIIAAVLIVELWCVCVMAQRLRLRSLVSRLSHFWLLLSVLIATDQQLVTSGDLAEPKSRPCNLLNLASRAIQRQFSCWINDSSSVKTCDCQRKMGNCVCEVYQHVANRRIWLLNDCIIHFWTYNVKRGDMARGRGGSGVEQGRCDRIRGCVKREETRLWEDI